MGHIATRFFATVVGVTLSSAIAFAQFTAPVAQPLPNLLTPQHLNQPPIQPLVETASTTELTPVPTNESVLRPAHTPKVVEIPQATARGAKVGSTWYDFQTNHSMPNRVAYFADGADKFLQVLWMASDDGTRDPGTRIPGFNNSRGSRYNFVDVNDPENPQPGIQTWKKMETERAGWPSIAMFNDGAGSIGTASHTPVKFFRNGGLGDDLFFEFSTVTSPADSAIWPRIAVDGNDNVHLIYNRSLPNSSGSESQLAYRRSTDGGSTWEPEIFFTGPNQITPAGQSFANTNNNFYGSGGDTYAISARDNVVAVVYSYLNQQVWVRKSTDYGRTWDDPNVGLRGVLGRNYNTLDSTLIGNGDSIRIFTDTVISPSQMHAVIIDSEGRIHMATGQILTYQVTTGPADPNAGGRTYSVGAMTNDSYLAGLGIYYWPEGDSLVYTIGRAGGKELWDGEGRIVSRRYFQGASRYPNLGIDADDNLYMVYTSVKNGDWMEMEIDTTGARVGQPDTLVTVNGLFGHVFLTHKLKDFPLWSDPVDVSTDGVNSLFATMADNVINDRMYIAYSASPVPGDRVTNVELEAVEADVMVMAVSKSELSPISSVDEAEELPPGELAVSVYTTAGERLIRSTSPTTDGQWLVEIPTGSLASGAYLLVVEQNGAAVTQTLNVLH